MNKLIRQSTAAILLIAVIAFQSCSPGNNISVGKVEEFRVTKLTKEHAEIELLIPVDNQNSFDLNLSDINIDVKADGIYLGKITNTEDIEFKSKTKSIYRFPLKVKFDLSVLLNPKLYNLLLSKEAEVALQGYIKVGAMWIFSKRIEVDQKEKINILNL